MTRRIPVLCWHKISTRPEPGITVVHPDRFQRQLDAVSQAGYSTISASIYIERQGMMDDAERLVLFTFDDAYACVYEQAWPLMKARGFSGVIFPVLDYIGKDNHWDRGLLGRRFRHMNDAEIEDLLRAGWDIGLHGRSHIPLKARDLTVLDRELVEARAELECRFGRNVHLLAWPFGQCDRRSVRVAEAAGLRAAFGRGPDDHPFCRDRAMIYPNHGPMAMQRMLEGGADDFLQRLAAMGAWLSARLHWNR